MIIGERERLVRRTMRPVTLMVHFVSCLEAMTMNKNMDKNMKGNRNGEQ